MNGNKEFFASLKSTSLKNIFGWTYGIRRRLVLLCIGNAAVAALALLFALLSRALIDSAVGAAEKDIINYALMLAATVALQLLIAFFNSRNLVYVRAKMQKNMRAQMLSEILKKDYASISKYHSGELVNRIFSDVNVVTEGVVNILPPFVLLITQIIGASVILCGIDPQFLLIILAAAVLSLLAALCFKKKAHRRTRKKPPTFLF